MCQAYEVLKEGNFSFFLSLCQTALMTAQTDEYLQSRADAMQNIESTVVELGGIFSQLAHMIKEQEEIMARIILTD